MKGQLSLVRCWLLVVTRGLLLLLSLAVTADAQTKRPNILWISTEDISPDLGCYGDSYAVTPNIDRLAAQGVRYTNAFATAPVCAPSRSAIITGMYPTTIGSMHMRSKAAPPAGVKAFTEYLRAAGYYCANNSKTDYNFEAPPAHRPPDTVWDDSSNTAHWRNRPDKSQPFFAVFNIMVTHESQVRVPDEQYKKNTARLKPEQFHDPAKAVLPPYYPDTPLVRKDWARYHDNITAMDYIVADLLKQLEEDGLTENTVVFFWGDHGRGLPRSKRFVYDSGLRVPLIARWPGQIQPGATNDDLVCLFDLGPTALSLAGAPIPTHMQAQAILGPQKKAPREYAFAHRDRMDETEDMARSVMGKRYHYIRNFHPDRPYFQYLDYLEEMPTMKEMRRLYKDHMNALDPKYGKALNPTQLLFMGPSKPPEELYDVTVDPHEIHNLAASPEAQAILKQMRAALDKWQKETNDLGFVPESELRERMRPGGVWRQVAAPTLSQTAVGDAVKVKLTCATEGSSIAYTTDSGEKPHWLLYTSELTLKRGVTLRFKACRLGYLDSQEIIEKF
ncbi:MAG TPA: sulfatase-like hydrolase/transferase [Blastocatellia bacterium]|nr:sulfatase-like hydrolase/transferase [Blastocatellia bacterium]